jgi:hypothetical protein
MHTGVGAAGALRQNVFPGNSSNGCGQRALNGRACRLNLPPQKISAVISERQLDVAEQHVWSRFRAALHPTDLRVYKHLPDLGGRVSMLAERIRYTV